jgi:hypothetical protein
VIADTVFRIPSGCDSGGDIAERNLRHCLFTVQLLSAVPNISYACWNVKLEVHTPVQLYNQYVDSMQERFSPLWEQGKLRVYERPYFPYRGDMRRYLEQLGNPGWLGMTDDDFRGFDRFPSLNGFPLVTDPAKVASILRVAMGDMSSSDALREATSGLVGQLINKEPPYMWGFRTRENEDATGYAGSSGPRFAIPTLGYSQSAFGQPLLQNMVFIRKGAPGEYPVGMNYCEDAWRQASCAKEAGSDAIGTHLITKIDFIRGCSKKGYVKTPEYLVDRQKFDAAFPLQPIKDRTSYTLETMSSMRFFRLSRNPFVEDWKRTHFSGARNCTLAITPIMRGAACW